MAISPGLIRGIGEDIRGRLFQQAGDNLRGVDLNLINPSAVDPAFLDSRNNVKAVMLDSAMLDLGGVCDQIRSNHDVQAQP